MWIRPRNDMRPLAAAPLFEDQLLRLRFFAGGRGLDGFAGRGAEAGPARLAKVTVTGIWLVGPAPPPVMASTPYADQAADEHVAGESRGRPLPEFPWSAE